MEHIRTAAFYLIFVMGILGWGLFGYASYTQAPIVISAPVSPLLTGRR